MKFNRFACVSMKRYASMTASEAFVETLSSHGVQDCFGIVGSAFMDALDLFPAAGIRFISVQHEQNAAHAADGYARVLSQRHGVCIAQNGPGVSNMVTGVAAAFYAHSPVVAITPESSSGTSGLGGFQEMNQLPLFESITKYQAHVTLPERIAELSAVALDTALLEHGPVQINIPRNMFYGEHDYHIPAPQNIQPPIASENALKEALSLVKNARRPVLLVGGGSVIGDSTAAAVALADHLSIPVVTTYLHNDAFPCDHPLYCGPLGYQGSQAGMNAIKSSDLIIALGTRLSPFGTLPQYGKPYWPSKTAKIIQVDVNARQLGRTQKVTLPIISDARDFASRLLQLLKKEDDSDVLCRMSSSERLSEIGRLKSEWSDLLATFTKGSSEDGRIKPRIALQKLQSRLPSDVIVSTDIGNICSVSNSYLGFNRPKSMLAAMTFGNCGYAFPALMGAKVAAPARPCVAYVGDGAWGMSLNEVLTCVRENIPLTAVVFRNEQWGAEKKNQVLWFGDRYVGTNHQNPPQMSYANIAKAMGAEGIICAHEDEVGDALTAALSAQKDGRTTVIEVMVTRELGDPFRRDAMRLPSRILPKYSKFTCKEESATGQPTDLNVQNIPSPH